MNSRKLTVLQVLPALNSGGVERGTLEIGKYLVEQGHRSLVMSAGGRMVEQLEREGSQHFTWPIGKKSLWTLRLIWRLRRFLQEQHVDILHVRSRLPGWLCYLAWKGMPPQTRPRFVTTVHGLYSVNAYSRVMTKGEKVVAVSETIRRYILTHYPQTPTAAIKLIPRGVDPASFPQGYMPQQEWIAAWCKQYPELAGKQVLTLPGRLTRLKGHEDFIVLMGRLIAAGLAVHGLIVGGANPKRQRYADEIRNRIAAAGLASHITMTGHRADLREVMAVSDIVFSLSTQPESFGRTTLEALSLGKPVIGYDHGGVGEILGNLFPQGKVPLRDLDALAQQTMLLCSQKMTPPAVHQYQLADMCRSTLDLYLDLVEAPRSAR